MDRLSYDFGYNKPFVVPVCCVFSNDYMATAEIVEKFNKHEEGPLYIIVVLILMTVKLFVKKTFVTN